MDNVMETDAKKSNRPLYNDEQLNDLRMNELLKSAAMSHVSLLIGFDWLIVL